MFHSVTLSGNVYRFIGAFKYNFIYHINADLYLSFEGVSRRSKRIG